MSSDSLRCSLRAEDIEGGVAAAFQRAKSEGKRSLTLVLDRSIRPTAALAEAFLSLPDDHGVCELYLVHPSPSIGFVASTLQLRMRSMMVRGMKSASEPPTQSDQSQVHARIAVITVASDVDGAALGRRLLQARSASAVAIVFSSAERPSRELVDAIADVLPQLPALQEMILVHPSPSVGFFASSLSLRAPRIELRAVRSVDDLERAS